MDVQLSHTTTPLIDKKFPIVLICDGVQSPANVGSLFRLCDALGVSEILFCNAQINFNSNRLLKTSRKTLSKTPYRVSNNIVSELRSLQKNGVEVVALELTNNSGPIESYQGPRSGKIALVIGAENQGISQEALNEVDTTLHITMHGKNSSMNVAQAAGIAVHTILHKLN